MKKIIIRLLISSICLGDILVLKNKQSYKGHLVKYVDGKQILFKALPSASLLLDINDIKDLTLSDGTKIFENGKILIYDFKIIDHYRHEKIILTTIIIGSFLYFIIKNIEIDFGDDYDLCFEPNCD